jgi:hypothetical protein
MNLRKNKKAVALILTLMMLFSMTANVMAAPLNPSNLGRIQLGAEGFDYKQYEYQDVSNPSQPNYEHFLTHYGNIILAGKTPVILLENIANGVPTWYNVAGRGLDSDYTAVAETTYKPVLVDGNDQPLETTQDVLQLIDDVLSGQFDLQALRDRYDLLGPDEKIAFDSQTGAYNELFPGTGPEPSQGPTPTGGPESTPTGTPPAEDGSIDRIVSINGTQVTVALTGYTGTATPPSSAFVVADNKETPYSVGGVNPTSDTGQYILSITPAVSGSGTLTVTYNGTEAILDFGGELTFTLEAESYSLRADGMAKTTLTFTAAQKGSNVPDPNFVGTAVFTSTQQADFTKFNPVAFDGGVATVELIAKYSSVATIVDTITATVDISPTHSELQGSTDQILVYYEPSPAGGRDGRILVTKMGSDNASHVDLTFDSAYDPTKLAAHLDEIYISQDKNVLAAPLGTYVWRRPAGFVRISENTVRINFTQTQPLKDNSEIYLTIDGGGTGPDAYLTEVENVLPFILNDSTAPASVSAVAKNSRTIEARFTEPVVTRDYLVNTVAVDGTLGTNPNFAYNRTQYLRGLTPISASELTNWSLNGKTILASELEQANPISQYGIDIGILDEETGEVVVYNDNTDNRAYVTIQLTRAGAERLLEPEGQTNLLQLNNAADFAGLWDPFNVAGIQEFRFVTPPADPPPAVIKIDQHSNEQYQITFNQAITPGTLTPGNIVFEYWDPNKPGNNKWERIDVRNDNAMDPIDKQITLTPFPLDSKNYLLELDADWSVVKDENYYLSNQNSVRIAVYSGTVDGVIYGPQIESRYGEPMVGRSSTTLGNFTLNRDATSPRVQNSPLAYVSHSITGNKYVNTRGYVEIEMSEPMQVNTQTSGADGKTRPLTPSTAQMANGGLTFNTNLSNYITSPGHTKANATNPSTFTFDRHAPNNGGVLETVEGDVIWVDLTDRTIVVEPQKELGAGNWTITIRSLSDDEGNSLDTPEYPLTIMQPETDPDIPEVVWVAVHDNIYDYRNGQYRIADLVYVQYSKNMSSDVTSISYYSVNKTRLPGGAIITKEDNVVYDPDETPGTLITIHLPYSFLGEDHEWFITSSPRFAAYSTTDPYLPAEDWSVFIDGRLTDNSAAHLSLDGDYDVVSTYHPNSVQGHVVAYVNADTDSLNTVLEPQNHKDIATMDDALASPFVKVAVPMTSTYYDSNSAILGGTPFADLSGTINVASDSLTISSTEPVGDVNVNFTSGTAKSFIVNAPEVGAVIISGISGEGSTVSVTAEEINGVVTITDDVETINIKAEEINDDVTITGDAKSITIETDEITGDVNITQTVAAEPGTIVVEGDISGSVTINANAAEIITIRENAGNPADGVGSNLTINSTSAITVRVDSSVTGNVVIRALVAHVYIDEDQVGGSVSIDAAAENSVTIASGVTITNLIINETSHGLKIYNGGTITNLTVATGPGYVRVLTLTGANGTLPASTSSGTNTVTTLQRATETSL